MLINDNPKLIDNLIKYIPHDDLYRNTTIDFDYYSRTRECPSKISLCILNKISMINNDDLKRLVIWGHQYKTKCILVCEDIRELCPGIRSNMDYIFITNDKPCDLKTIYRIMNYDISEDKFINLVNDNDVVIISLTYGDHLIYKFNYRVNTSSFLHIMDI